MELGTNKSQRQYGTRNKQIVGVIARRNRTTYDIPSFVFFCIENPSYTSSSHHNQ